MAARVALALDIGATNLRACLGTSDGFIRNRVSLEIKGIGGNEQFLAKLDELIHRALKGYSLDEVAGVGVGCIGPLDVKEGVLLAPVNMPVRNVFLTNHLSKLTGKDIVLLNDGNAAAWGEYIYGAGKRTRNLVHITFGTGIGGGAVMDGRLILGKDGNALEVGHMVIDYEENLTCGCGQGGHWEAYCSGTGIPKLVLLERRKSRSEGILERSLLDEIEGVTAERVFEAARAGDWLALRVLKFFSNLNTIGMINLAHIFDPDLITIGGAVVLRNPDMVIEPIKKTIAGKLIVRKPSISLTPLADDATLMGAIAAVFNSPFSPRHG